MGWFILIAAIVIIFYIVMAGKDDADNETPISISVKTSSRNTFNDPEYVVDTGKITQIDDNIFCINPKSPLPITLKGLSSTDANVFKELLDGEARWQRNINDITFLIAELNIECIELEEFIHQARSEVSSYIENEKQHSQEWAQSSEKDRADIERELQTQAIERLSIRPSNDQALETLVFSSPSDVTADDRILKLFSGNKDIYRFYISNLGRSSKTFQVPADDYYRKTWETLVSLGLARRGKDIPIQILLDSLRMKDINDYFSDRLDKKITRKAKAVEFALSQPDAIDVLSKHISFREMFQITEPQGIEVSEIKRCYEYASAQAEIIRDTYVTAFHALENFEEAKDSYYDGWEILSEDCCQHCSKLNGKKTKRRPSKIPPFHIGCTCSIEGI